MAKRKECWEIEDECDNIFDITKKHKVENKLVEKKLVAKKLVAKWSQRVHEQYRQQEQEQKLKIICLRKTIQNNPDQWYCLPYSLCSPENLEIDGRWVITKNVIIPCKGNYLDWNSAAVELPDGKTIPVSTLVLENLENVNFDFFLDVFNLWNTQDEQCYQADPCLKTRKIFYLSPRRKVEGMF